MIHLSSSPVKVKNIKFSSPLFQRNITRVASGSGSGERRGEEGRGGDEREPKGKS